MVLSRPPSHSYDSATTPTTTSCPPAVIVRSAKTGLEVRNVLIMMSANATNREQGTIVFKPEFGPGEYHAYYLPHTSRDAGAKGQFWTVETIYTPYNVSAADPAWAQRVAMASSGSSTHADAAVAPPLPSAEFLELEPRVEFHRFTDMELIATKAEVAALKAKLPTGSADAAAAAADEKEKVAGGGSTSSARRVVVFPEDRTNPLRLTNVTDDPDLLPVRWAGPHATPPSQSFHGTARRGEWYAFQLGVWAVDGPAQILAVDFEGEGLLAESSTCLNLGGVDETGLAFNKTVYLAAGQINSIWCGLQVPIDAKPGSTLQSVAAMAFADGIKPVKIDLNIAISSDAAEEPLYDHGDADVWRMSRLRWLDSTIGSDDSEVPTPYGKVNHTTLSTTAAADPIAFSANILGRTLAIGQSGLPADIMASKYGGRQAKLLNSPMELRLLTASASSSSTADDDDDGDGVAMIADPTAAGDSNVEITESSNSKLSWSARTSYSSYSSTAAAAGATAGHAEGGDTSASACEVTINGSLWFDGYGQYSMTIATPAAGPAQQSFEDIQLRLDLNGSIAKFMMGFGRSGGSIDGGFGGLPLHWEWGDGPYQLWAGNPDAGLRLKLTGPEVGWAAPSYSYGANPPAWDNGKRGGANITRQQNSSSSTGSAVELVAYTGPVTINASSSMTLYFEMLLTPVKPLNRGVGHKHWGERMYQVGYGENGSAFATAAEVAQTGATVANLHQGIGASSVVSWPGHNDVDEGLLNPYINWPFEPSSVQLMADWVREASALNIRTKFYYTVRELSNHAAELWALRSLGTEILAGGKRDVHHGTQSGSSWLTEHLVDDYSHCWQNPLTNGEFDSAVCDTGVSRWTNWYIEGLNLSTSGPPNIDGICKSTTASINPFTPIKI